MKNPPFFFCRGQRPRTIYRQPPTANCQLPTATIRQPPTANPLCCSKEHLISVVPFQPLPPPLPLPQPSPLPSPLPASFPPRSQLLYQEWLLNTSIFDPATAFFLACGPVVDDYCAEVQDVVTALTDSGRTAHFLDQRHLQGAACCGRPSVADHTRMADHAAADVGGTLGWTYYGRAGVAPAAGPLLSTQSDPWSCRLRLCPLRVRLPSAVVVSICPKPSFKRETCCAGPAGHLLGVF